MTEIQSREIITRKQALQSGLKHYFTGKPCKRGHVANRNTRTVHCLECTKENSLRYGQILRKNDWGRYKLYQKKHQKKQREASLKWRVRNPDKVKEYKKESYKRNKSTSIAWKNKNYIEVKIKRGEWRRCNTDKVKAMRKRSYRKNKEKHLIGVRRWMKNNPIKVKSYRTNHKAKRRKAVGKHTAGDIRFLLGKQKNKCAECKCKIAIKPEKGEAKLHIDHIMPIALGGSNDKRNLQCLCLSCNISKGAKHPVQWARENNRLI